MQNQKLIFSFKFPFNLAADPAPRREAGEAETLAYPKVWCLLKKVRTYYKENPAADF